MSSDDCYRYTESILVHDPTSLQELKAQMMPWVFWRFHQGATGNIFE